MSTETPAPVVVPTSGTPSDAVSDGVPVAVASTPAPAAKGPRHTTPKDMVDGLRLIKAEGYLTKDDDEQILGLLSGLAGDYVKERRLGKISITFAEWYENSDAEEMDVVGKEEVAEEDPTTLSDAS